MRAGAAIRAYSPTGMTARLKDWTMGIFRALALAAGLVFMTEGHVLAQGAVKSVHKDWQIRCDAPPGAKTFAKKVDWLVSRGGIAPESREQQKQRHAERIIVEPPMDEDAESQRQQ